MGGLADVSVPSPRRSLRFGHRFFILPMCLPNSGHRSRLWRALSLAADLSKSTSNPVTLAIADATALPFPARTFDLILSFETIEHLQQDDTFISWAEPLTATRRYLANLDSELPPHGVNMQPPSQPIPCQGVHFCTVTGPIDYGVRSRTNPWSAGSTDIRPLPLLGPGGGYVDCPGTPTRSPMETTTSGQGQRARPHGQLASLASPSLSRRRRVYLRYSRR